MSSAVWRRIAVGTRKDDGSVHRYRNVRLFSRAGNEWIMELWYNYEITGLRTEEPWKLPAQFNTRVQSEV